jgi:signal transduction histidine kinase
MANWSGTGRRLFAAFGLLILAYGVASFFTLAALREIHGALHRTKERADSVRLALELASAVRDQYAHQAHTIILGDASHLPLYDGAQRRVRELTAAVRLRADSPEETRWLDDIERATDDLDHIFRERILPAVLKGRRAEVQAEHGRAQLQVTLIQERTTMLVDRLEASIKAFETHVNALEHRTNRWTALFLVGAPVIAVAVGVYIVQSIARPVSRLHEGAARLAAGDLHTSIDIQSPDEFGALARQFNTMTQALRENQERLVQSEKLAGIGRLAAGVAHEINNPLGVILGYTRLMKKRADASTASDLAIIEDETLRCREIVEGLLDLSRPLGAPRQPVDLRELCDDVVTRLADSKALDGVSLTVLGGATTLGHPLKLRQVLLNLVRNAVEAAGPGGRVDVQVASSGDVATVSVADTGPGIEPRTQDRLFEPFFTTKPHGTGLGLAVSQAIARAHKGTIEASAAPGGGALFTLRLPTDPTGGK